MLIDQQKRVYLRYKSKSFTFTLVKYKNFLTGANFIKKIWDNFPNIFLNSLVDKKYCSVVSYILLIRFHFTSTPNLMDSAKI